MIKATSRENRSSEFLTTSDTNRPVQLKKMARNLKFRINEKEELYYPSIENKGADQLCIYWFSHHAAHNMSVQYKL